LIYQSLLDLEQWSVASIQATAAEQPRYVSSIHVRRNINEREPWLTSA
jgi:hypothetical protein